MEQQTTDVTTTENATPRERTWMTPAVDVYESESEYLLVANMPGVAAESLHLDLKAGDLLMEGLRGESWGYRRLFRVPETVDGERVEAKLTDGVLNVHLPKHARVLPRRIRVQVG